MLNFKKGEKMSRVVNIDEKISAKAEFNREPIVLTFRGIEWNFSASMPAQLPEYVGEGKIVTGLMLALKVEQREEFEQLGITIDEVKVIFEELSKMYGSTEGESQASESQ
jgi:hypothetical protein